jgi:thioredoxin-like negative regulator of GroEL
MTRKELASLVVLVLLLALAPAGLAQATEPFVLPGLAGDRLSEQDLAGSPVLAVFWSSWSPRCRDLPQRFAAFTTRLSGRARLVAINYQEDRRAAGTLLQGTGVPVYLDADGGFAKRFGIATLPGAVLFRGGAVVWQGRLDEAALAEVERALGE